MDKSVAPCDDACVTTALAKLELQLGDVDNLLVRHPNRTPDQTDPETGEAAARQAGRPAGDQKPLLRSCVLLTYAAWEVYAEDSLIAVVASLAQNASLEQLPQTLRSFLAESVSADPLALAGEGWRSCLEEAVTLKLRGSDRDDGSGWGLNTASPGKIAALQDELLGVRLLSLVVWQGKKNSKIKQELADLVRIRGSIAHTGTTPGALNLVGAEAWRTFIWNLGSKLDAQLDEWTMNQLAK